MRRIYFTYDESILNEYAKEIFLNISGLNREGKKYDRMRLDSEMVRSLVINQFVPEVECLYTDNVKLNDDSAIIEGTSFKCRAFDQLDDTSVNGAFVYAITSGNFQLPNESVINQLYADLWGTAYTDALRLFVMEQLEEQYNISDSFGPGFYGMDMSETVKIAEIIDFNALGIELKDNGVMVPLKSCTGLYFTVNDKYKPLDAACADCKGNHSSCRLCQMNGGL